MEIRKLVKLPKLEYYKTHLSLINCLLPTKMSRMELKVIACFMSLEGDIAQHRFGPSAKKIVMNTLELSPAGLSNHLVALTKKGFLFKIGDAINILPLLVPSNGEQIYMFKLINTGE